MSNLPAPHPQRASLYDEVHARPPSALATPSRISHLALLMSADRREAETAHVAELCRHFAVDPPGAAASQFNASLGALQFTWERHGEFSGFTFALPGEAQGGQSVPAVSLLPVGWLAALPGETLIAVDARLIPEPDDEGPARSSLTAHFQNSAAVGAEIGDGAGILLTDFRVRDDGYSQVILIDRSLTVRQAGRTLQRFFEIEVYRMLALLALPIARRQLGQIGLLEDRLAVLAKETASVSTSSGTESDEALLHLITSLAGTIESELAASQFRFGACRAYAELVSTRISELREHRLAGLQTIGEFMDRRFKPAVATCATVEQRLHDLSTRVSRASALLSTRVAIARERQNQALLASMNRRAKAQLRLQETVEGLSVAAIVYYAAGLVAYVAKGFKSHGFPVDVDLVIAISVPVLAALVMLATRRARRRALAMDER